jgi:hypothetical protein
VKRKALVKVLLIAIIGVSVILILAPVIIQPIVKSKLEQALNRNKDYRIETGKVKLSLMPASLEIGDVTITGITNNLYGKIGSVKINRIQLIKALFKKEYEVGEVNISNAHLAGKVPGSKSSRSPSVLGTNVRINRMAFSQINLALITKAGTVSVKDGNLRLQHLNIAKGDSLSSGLLHHIGFEIKELSLVQADSFYTYTARGVVYNDTAKKMSLSNLIIHPNYPNYEFAARHKFQIDHIEVQTSNISFYHLSADTFFSAQKLLISYVEIEKAGICVFRDRRKEFKHEKKPTLQELISTFPNTLCIDSLRLMNSDITYVEHAEKAIEPGKIIFTEAKARIYNITNDEGYKEIKPYLELRSSALLMGKGRFTVSLKARLFDPGNSFFMHGNLSGMDVKEFNSVTEKSAFIRLSSGRIDSMNFRFVADNTKATGNMIFCYHGLNLTVKNKHTNDTTALKEQVKSFIANAGIIDSNPKPGEPVREGVIDYKRDPERFIFNYCAKALMTGINSSLKKPKKTFLQKVFGKKQ